MTDTMPEKMDLSSVSPSDEKLAALRDLIPEAFTEGKIDFDALRRSLGDAVETAPREERFGLRWPGKSKLQQVINQPSVGTLVPQPEESVDWDTTQNIIIEGDNLEVLKLLQKSYAGKVKMIYIDPPYNTGNDFVYPDNHIEGLQSYLEFTGQRDTNGRMLQSNTESEGRYHANWLNMMYPRLYLARALLRDDGLIFVSIDDSEASNLRHLMNEVFGEENFLATLVRRSMHTVRNSAKDFNLNADYLLCYGRNKGWFGESPDRYIRKSVDKSDSYTRDDHDGRGPYKLDPLTARNYNRPYKYKFSNGIEWEAKGGRYPAFSQESLARMEKEGRIYFGGREPMMKRYLADVQQGQPPDQILDSDDVGFNMHGTSEVAALLGESAIFSQPKPVRLLKHLLDISRVSTADDIVLDFFAGSGTTAHAIMQQNAEEGGNRRYILVQLPEPLDKPKTLDDGTTLSTIADICRERVRRAGKKIAEENEGKTLDIGFRAYRLALSNFRPWDGRIGQDGGDGIMTSARQASFMPQTIQQQLELAADHLRPNANDDSLLAELLLRLGFELTTPVAKETLAGKTVYNVDDGLVLICLDRHITLDVIEAMAKRMPAEIICLDAGFPDDSIKVNAGQIIASHARDEETSIAFKVV